MHFSTSFQWIYSISLFLSNVTGFVKLLFWDIKAVLVVIDVHNYVLQIIFYKWNFGFKFKLIYLWYCIHIVKLSFTKLYEFLSSTSIWKFLQTLVHIDFYIFMLALIDDMLVCYILKHLLIRAYKEKGMQISPENRGKMYLHT